MEDTKVAILLPFFNHVSSSRRIEFLRSIDSSLTKGSLILVGNAEVPSHLKLENSVIISYKHSNSTADAFKDAFRIGIINEANKFVTFEDYSIQNSKWFVPYLILSNVVESKRRSLLDTLLIGFTNLLSFRNTYNIFSMNRIFDIEAADIISKSNLGGNIAVKLTNLLNEHNIKVTEVIRKDKESPSNHNIMHSLSIVRDSISKSTVIYGLFGSLSYILNLLIIYLSLSFGLLYPIAFFIGQETSMFSNFILNKSITLRSRDISLSTFGKYNVLVSIFVLLDLFLIWLIKILSNGVISAGSTALVIIPTIFVSIFSTMTLNKFIWSRNTVKIKS